MEFVPVLGTTGVVHDESAVSLLQSRKAVRAEGALFLDEKTIFTASYKTSPTVMNSS